VCIEQRNAWCVDHTENGSGVVATADIPGESDLILIAPGCREWNENDGQFRERDLLSPEQCYYNAAVLPTWQKYMPTYRWGTITSINRGANSANVSLFNSTSSAQRINVVLDDTLTNVQFSYMTCHHAAFEVGDDVVVRFILQSPDLPVIIGFVDNPRQCGNTQFNLIDVSYVEGFLTVPEYYRTIYFGRLTDTPLRTLISTTPGNYKVEYSSNNGAWVDIPYEQALGFGAHRWAVIQAAGGTPSFTVISIHIALDNTGYTFIINATDANGLCSLGGTTAIRVIDNPESKVVIQCEVAAILDPANFVLYTSGGGLAPYKYGSGVGYVGRTSTIALAFDPAGNTIELFPDA
jgi:hypothetical protein